jgi:protein gp37
MVDTTAISWTNATFNPWIGCTKVSEACRNCYAERDNAFRKWNGGTWGPSAPRKVTSEANWRKPLQWNHQAILDGVRRRVFTASLADVFDAEAPEDAQVRLFDLIEACDALDWLVLTKRPENAVEFYRARYGDGPIPPNIWQGVSVENQAAADLRIPLLLQIPAKVRFLSMEPLLGPVDLGAWLGDTHENKEIGRVDLLGGIRVSDLDRRGGARLARGFDQGGASLREVPAGEGDAPRETSSRSGSPAGVAALQRPDSGRTHHQPQERDRNGQPAGESGTRDSERAGHSLAARTAEWESGRREEPSGEADGRASAGDPQAASGGRAVEADRSGLRCDGQDHLKDRSRSAPTIGWCIVGGESGPNARPSHPDWFRSIRAQCLAVGVPFHFKQWGEWKPFPSNKVPMPPEAVAEMSALNPNTPTCLVKTDGTMVRPYAITDGPGYQMVRVGKKAAGRLLDGVEWNEFPVPSEVH